MRGKVLFFSGLAAGFVLGARAGRETYDELTRTVRKIKDNPTVQETAGTLQEQAVRLYNQCMAKVSSGIEEAKHRCGCHPERGHAPTEESAKTTEPGEPGPVASTGPEVVEVGAPRLGETGEPKTGGVPGAGLDAPRIP